MESNTVNMDRVSYDDLQRKARLFEELIEENTNVVVIPYRQIHFSATHIVSRVDVGELLNSALLDQVTILEKKIAMHLGKDTEYKTEKRWYHKFMK